MFRIKDKKTEKGGWGGSISLAVMSIGSGFVALLLGAAVYGLPMFWAYFSNPLLLALNIIPVVLFAFLIYFATGRAWIGFLASSLIFIAAAAGNFFKIALRNEPFVALDFNYLGEAGGILSKYELTVNWKIIAAALYLIIGTAVVFVMSEKKIKSAAVRISGVVLICAASVLLYTKVYTRAAVYNKAASSYEINIWNENQKYMTRGFVYPFIYSIRDAVPQKPEGYSAELGEAALEGYEDSDIPDDKKVNIVAIMLEAYSDLSRFDSIKTLGVYEPLYELYEDSVHGELVANIFAGGTINTERAFLTGYSNQDNYRADVDSFVRYLDGQGYYTEGLHTGDGWFYNRENINFYLGFDGYYFLEDFENGSRYDEFFFSQLKSMYESRDKSVPYFNFSVTYQNHGSYNDAETVDTAYLVKGDMSDGSYNILNNYLSGIADTTARIRELADYFEKDSEPVVLIIFGDHMPWMGNSNSVYNELGIDVEASSDEGFLTRFETPYIVFANSAAKKVLGNDFNGYGGSFSPCFFMERVFEMCGYEGSGYMKYLRELSGTIDIMSTAVSRFRVDGELTTSLSGEALSKFTDFQYAEYYMRHKKIK